MTIANSDVMYRHLVQGVEDYAIYMLSPDGTVANWNAGAERTSYAADEIVGQNFSCFYTPEDRASGLPQAGLARARDRGKFAAEGWRVRKDGTLFWASVVIDAIHGDGGELLGYAKITRDETERRMQEQQLLRAKEMTERYNAELGSLSSFLDAVISQIPSCVLVMDAVSRRIVLANRQVQAMFGVDRADMRGRTMQECLPEQACAFFERLCNDALRSDGAMREEEEELSTTLGPRSLRTKTLVFHNSDPRSRYVLLIADDVTDENAAHAQVRYMAHHDTLTGMPNRRLFREQMLKALNAASDGRATAVLCLDLDNFKSVNDTLGHQFGDELLRLLAKRSPKVLREQDTLARLGGDEFAVVLPNIEQTEDVRRMAQRLVDAVRAPFEIDGHTVPVTVSIGIAVADTPECTADHLLRYADMALYEAKRNGRNGMAFFKPEMETTALKRHEMEMDLRQAIISQQLRLHYQPIKDASHVRTVGREALMRWQHPTKGLIMPNDFIPVAEETGLIHELSAFTLHEACREAMRWEPHETVAVNLSASQFANSALVSLVESALTTPACRPTGWSWRSPNRCCWPIRRPTCPR